MKKYLYLLLLLMFSFNSQIIAQSLNTLSGVVLDKSTGEELLGVNVRIEGTTNGTITDFNGSFSDRKSVV